MAMADMILTVVRVIIATVLVMATVHPCHLIFLLGDV